MSDRNPLKESLVALKNEHVFGEILLYRFVADAFEWANVDPDRLSQLKNGDSDESEYLISVVHEYSSIVVSEFTQEAESEGWERAERTFRAAVVDKCNTEGVEWRNELHDFFEMRDRDIHDQTVHDKHLCTENDVIHRLANGLADDASEITKRFGDSLWFPVEQCHHDEDCDAVACLRILLKAAIYAGPVTEEGSFYEWKDRGLNRMYSAPCINDLKI